VVVEQEHDGTEVVDDVEVDQIVERLAWSPEERLRYLLDMLAFEERAHASRIVGRST
jgi:hypothetical protein